MDDQQWLNWGNKFLAEAFDPSSEVKIRKWDITLTPEHFVRLRKTYQHGKQEYYSFNLRRLSAMNYVLGNGLNDTLTIITQADDIIVQTYDDPKGDVDSMATSLVIPIKKAAASRVDSLKQALLVLKGKGM